MRVIIQEEALRRSEGHHYHHLIQALPTIDAEPVRNGYWIKGTYTYLCSECGERTKHTGAKYCPECGAKMDGGHSNGS